MSARTEASLRTSLARAMMLCTGCALGIVFVGLRIAKINKQTVAQILYDVSLKASDNLAAGFLICLHYFAQILRVQLF